MAIEFFYKRNDFPDSFVEQVINIDSLVMDFPWSREQWEDYLNKELNWMVAVEVKDDLVRCFALFQLSTDDWSHLLKIGVDHSYKGRGIATLLLRESIGKLSEHFLTCSLEVREDNQAAIKLYLRHKFELLHQISHYYSDGSTAVKMIATLR